MIHQHYCDSNSHNNSTRLRSHTPSGKLSDPEHSCPSAWESGTGEDENEIYRRRRHFRLRCQTLPPNSRGEDRERERSSEVLLLRAVRACGRAQRELGIAVGRMNDEERELSAAATSVPAGDRFGAGAGGPALRKQKGMRLRRAKRLLRNAASRFDDVERTLEEAAGVLSDDDCGHADEELDCTGCRARRRPPRRASITIEDDGEDYERQAPIASGGLTQSSNSTPTSTPLTFGPESGPQKHENSSCVDVDEAKKALEHHMLVEQDTSMWSSCGSSTSGSEEEEEEGDTWRAAHSKPVIGASDKGTAEESEHLANGCSGQQRTDAGRPIAIATATKAALEPNALPVNKCRAPDHCARQQHWPRQPRPQGRVLQSHSRRSGAPDAECGARAGSTCYCSRAFEQRLVARLLRSCPSALFGVEYEV